MYWTSDWLFFILELFLFITFPLGTKREQRIWQLPVDATGTNKISISHLSKLVEQAFLFFRNLFTKNNIKLFRVFIATLIPFPNDLPSFHLVFENFDMTPTKNWTNCDFQPICFNVVGWAGGKSDYTKLKT